jgi:hypothetical protein
MSFLSQLALRDSNAWVDEVAQVYAFAMFMHAASDRTRADQGVKCGIATRPGGVDVAWDILCERLDGRDRSRDPPCPCSTG